MVMVTPPTEGKPDAQVPKDSVVAAVRLVEVLFSRSLRSTSLRSRFRQGVIKIASAGKRAKQNERIARSA